MFCCYQFRKEEMVQCLPQGHMTSTLWDCDRKPDLTLNPRLYKDHLILALHCIALPFLPLPPSPHIHSVNTFPLHLFFSD